MTINGRSKRDTLLCNEPRADVRALISHTPREFMRQRVKNGPRVPTIALHTARAVLTAARGTAGSPGLARVR